MEGRGMTVVDVPGAFITAHMDEEVYMLLDGEMMEAMRRIVPETYAKYVFKNTRGRSMLYMRLNKVLYGCLRAALFFIGSFEKNWSISVS